jgi:hypothetical protein
MEYQNMKLFFEVVQEFQRNGIRTSIFVDPFSKWSKELKLEPRESNCIQRRLHTNTV